MTISKLIEFLQKHDQDAIVRVVVHSDGHSYYEQGGRCTTEVFDPEKHFEYTDFRGNQWAKGKPYENERNILLGVN